MFALVSLLENLHDHNAVATTASELLGPTLWTSRYVHCSHPVPLYIYLVILETLDCLGPWKHPVGLLITSVDSLQEASIWAAEGRCWSCSARWRPNAWTCWWQTPWDLLFRSTEAWSQGRRAASFAWRTYLVAWISQRSWTARWESGVLQNRLTAAPEATTLEDPFSRVRIKYADEDRISYWSISN